MFKKNGYLLYFFILTGLLVPSFLSAQLAAGDIAIIGFHFDNPDELGFVALTELASGAEIKFTDNGWYAAGGFRATEGIHTWTASSTISAGSVVIISVSGPAFSTSGDQILAYQGLDSSPTFMYGLNSEGAGVWQADATSSNTSAFPTGLTSLSSIALFEADNGFYSGPTSGTKTELLNHISNVTNWTTNDTRIANSYPPSFNIIGGADTPPNVSSTTPSNTSTNVVTNSNITINFSENVTVGGSWYSITGSLSGSHTAVVSGTSPSFILNPDIDYTEGEIITVTVYAAQVTDQDGTPDNMATDYNFSFTITTPGTALDIFEIQGSGLTSAYDGLSVTTEGDVVTAVGSEGFFIQTPTASTDGNANTSDGIYVYTTTTPTVSVGDIVSVTGLVQEFYDFTEIINPAITVTGTGSLPTPVAFNATTPTPVQPQSAIEYERFEGMLVSITGGIINGSNQYFGTDPIAEVYITAGTNRVFRETGIEYPGLGGTIPTWDGNPEIFELDPDKLGLTNRTINGGSTFNATGVVGYEYSGYELWPKTLSVTETSLPVAVRDKAANEFTVGALNLYRLFDEVSDGGEETVPLAEYNLRLSKLSMYIRNVLKSPDILAVSEVEKLGSLQDLANKITTDDASVIYTSYLQEGNDVGGIDVGFLVQEKRVQVDLVTQLGKNETWIDPNVGGSALLHDRPPLLLEGRLIKSPIINAPIAVMALHIRSMNGVETNRVQQKRLTQAQSIAGYIQNLQTIDPNINLIVTGDMNAFEFTDGYVDVIGQIMGNFDTSHNLLSGPDLVSPNLTNQVLSTPAYDRYSFIYKGSAQVLDHSLTSSHLNSAVSDLVFGKANCDAAIDFSNIDGNPLRSSDHDGLVLFLDGKEITSISTLVCKVFLEGPYNTGGTMFTNINGNIPTTAPYTEDPREVSTVPVGAVDWILLELRNETDGSSGVDYHSCFIKSNGILIADDGSEGIDLAINGNKYIVIKHRNHLGVMSSSPVVFALSTTSNYDFTTAQTQAYKPGSEDPMIEIDTIPLAFGMIRGDANANAVINSADYLSVMPNIGGVEYSDSDINLNNAVNSADYLLIKSNVGKVSQVPITD